MANNSRHEGISEPRWTAQAKAVRTRRSIRSFADFAGHLSPEIDIPSFPSTRLGLRAVGIENARYLRAATYCERLCGLKETSVVLLSRPKLGGRATRRSGVSGGEGHTGFLGQEERPLMCSLTGSSKLSKPAWKEITGIQYLKRTTLEIGSE